MFWNKLTKKCKTNTLKTLLKEILKYLKNVKIT